MDPLSVAASVVGLLAAGGKVSSLLVTVVTKGRDAANLAQSLLREVSDISAALGHLQSYILQRISVPPARGSLILLEHILTSLTGCVTTYSDLQATLDTLSIEPNMGVFDGFKWVRKESSLKEICQRLQNHKMSLTLMLTILQWHVEPMARDAVAMLTYVSANLPKRLRPAIEDCVTSWKRC